MARISQSRPDSGLDVQVKVLKTLLVAPSSGPLGFDFAQHRQTLRPSVDGVRSKALHPFGLQ